MITELTFGAKYATLMEQLEALKKWHRVYTQIELTWGTKECEDLLDSLITDRTRGIGRQGFPLEVLDIIMNLYSLHRSRWNFNPSTNKYDESMFGTL